MDREGKILLQIAIVTVVYRAEQRRASPTPVALPDGHIAELRERCLAMLAGTESTIDGHGTAKVRAALRDARQLLAC